MPLGMLSGDWAFASIRDSLGGGKSRSGLDPAGQLLRGERWLEIQFDAMRCQALMWLRSLEKMSMSTDCRG